MRSASLYGWNGKFNVGDDAMTQIMVAHLQQCYGEDTAIKILADKHRLPLMKGNIQAFRNFENVNQIKGLRTYFNLYFYIPSFVDSNLLLFGGGSLFHTAKNTQFFQDVLHKFKTKGGEKAGSIGVSVGPFKDEAAKKANLKFFESLDFLVVRDEKSFQILKENDVQVKYEKAIDLAVLYPQYFDLKKATKKKRIGISLRSEFHSEQQLQMLASSIEKLNEDRSDYTFVFYAFCEYANANDNVEIKALLSKLSAKVKTEIVPYSLDTKSFYESIAELELMIATRLHAAIISYTVNTPAVMLSYHEKCREFANMVGSPSQSVLDLNDLKEDHLVNVLHSSLSSNSFYSLPQNTAMDIAKINFKYL